MRKKKGKWQSLERCNLLIVWFQALCLQWDTLSVSAIIRALVLHPTHPPPPPIVVDVRTRRAHANTFLSDFYFLWLLYMIISVLILLNIILYFVVRVKWSFLRRYFIQYSSSSLTLYAYTAHSKHGCQQTPDPAGINTDVNFHFSLLWNQTEGNLCFALTFYCSTPSLLSVLLLALYTRRVLLPPFFFLFFLKVTFTR